MRWFALLIGILLVAVAFTAGTRVSDTREGLIAEVVTLLAGMAGVILLISALSLMRSPSAAATSTPAARAAQPPRRRSRNDIWLGTGGIALAIVLLAGLAVSAGFWWSVAGLVLLLPMILGSLYLCVRFLRASP